MRSQIPLTPYIQPIQAVACCNEPKTRVRLASSATKTIPGASPNNRSEEFYRTFICVDITYYGGSVVKKDAQCIFLVEGDMLRQLKTVAASNRFRSMSEMIRNIMKQYLDQEVRRG
jgi:hypothetical protein